MGRGLRTVSEISRFRGIVVRMYFDDHPPPHFHAVHGDYSVVVELATGTVEGRFPAGSLRDLLRWYHRHRDELRWNWKLVTSGKNPLPIDPLR